MKLLIVASNLKRQGFYQRVLVYLDFLRQAGIHCDVQTLSSFPLQRWWLYVRSRQYDAVWMVKKLLTFSDAQILRFFARRILYSYDDAVMFGDHCPSAQKGLHWRRWLHSVRIADWILTGSPYLASLAEPYHSHVFVLPIGLRLADYKVKDWEQTNGIIRLVWIGSRSTLRYLEEIRPVLEELGRNYPNVKLRIIGDDFLDLQNMAVEKIPWSQEARREGLATADIGLAPLPDTPFTRGKCSFKVLEYSASGLPVIGSPVGTNVHYIQHGESGYLVKSPQEWLSRIEKLVCHRELCRKMGLAGREYAKQYDVGVVGIQLQEILRKVGG